MKNKEIEELLNKIKQQLLIDKRLGKEIAQDFHKTTLNYKEIKILLSYIEQLEKENEKANKYIDFYKDLTEKQNKSLEEFKQENKQLENNRDKAIERCEFWLDFYRNVNNDNIIILRLNDILSKLKGDSDEN